MRPLFSYILLAVAVAFVAMFFICQHSRSVRLGYRLTRLRRERDRLVEEGRRLDSAIWHAAKREELEKTAARLGLRLVSPVSEETGTRE